MNYKQQMVRQVKMAMADLMELITEDGSREEDEALFSDYGELIKYDYFDPDEHQIWLAYFKECATALGSHEIILSQLSLHTLQNLAVLFFIGAKLLEDML